MYPMFLLWSRAMLLVFSTSQTDVPPCPSGRENCRGGISESVTRVTRVTPLKSFYFG
jgi:hypothetical protein